MIGGSAREGQGINSTINLKREGPRGRLGGRTQKQNFVGNPYVGGWLTKKNWSGGEDYGKNWKNFGGGEQAGISELIQDKKRSRWPGIWGWLFGAVA